MISECFKQKTLKEWCAPKRNYFWKDVYVGWFIDGGVAIAKNIKKGSDKGITIRGDQK